MDLTEEQIRTLWHMLGLDPGKPWKKSYRNYAAVNPELSFREYLGMLQQHSGF